MKTLITFTIISFLSTGIFFGCSKKSTTAAASTTGGNSGGSSGGSGGSSGSSGQTMAQLSQNGGGGYYCSTESGLGSTLAPNGMTHELFLQSNGDFDYTVVINDGSSTGCASSLTSNGTQIATYTVSGTYAVNNGVSASGVTATQVAYTIQSVTMTLQSGSNAEETSLANWLHANCGISFNTSSTSAQSVAGATCTAVSGFSAVNLPNVGDIVYNLAYNGGSNVESGTRLDMWRPGTSSYPSSLVETYAP